MILKSISRIIISIFSAVVLLLSGCSKLDNEDTVPALKIGVMLPFSGDYAADWDKALNWAADNINVGGGVNGRKIELVRKDIGSEDVEKCADAFISNKEIKAVIGPLTSTDVFKVAPKFIISKKLLLAPVATAASISRAFSGYDYFWRLTEPDISQVKTLLLLAQKNGARSVSLITEDSEYGSSFEDWFGYFATELGLSVTSVNVITPGDISMIAATWDSTIKTSPDAVIVALNSPSQNIGLIRAYRASGTPRPLLFSDAACLPVIPSALGTLAENLQGTNISSDPSSGFDISYKLKFGSYPGSFLANIYDAVMLLGLSLEASNGEGGKDLAEAMKRVVSGREGKCSWQRDGIGSALLLIRAGIYPDIRGASGDLGFDELYYTDVSSTTYGHWRIDDGEFVVTDFYTSDGSGRMSSTSAAYRVLTEKKQQFTANGTWPALLPKSGLYAFLIATSGGWSNYRHQADVLRIYQSLKTGGLDDDHIILIMADDLATDAQNKTPGIIKNEPLGPNLYHNVKVDYLLKNINAGDIANILEGVGTASTPDVLLTKQSDNILIFSSGHGNPGGMELDGKENELLSPFFWKSVFDNMYQNNKFRQIFWALESCYSGKIGEAISTPGVMIMTGANPYETSRAFYYDATNGTWLSDKFAYSVNNAIITTPNIKFSELYERCFSFVNGSHVSFYNYQNFGNIYNTGIKEFVRP